MENRTLFHFLASLLLTVPLANVTSQILLRFLLINWSRAILITALLILIFFPLTYFLIKKMAAVSKLSTQWHLALRVGISLLTAILFYVLMPVKITGNLLILDQSFFILYKISRLINITGFIFTIFISLFVILTSIAYKMNGKIAWSLITELFFIGSLIIGCLIYQDYGISSDEPNDRISGMVSAKYVADFIEEIIPDMDPYLPKLSTYRYRYYGVAYQFPLAVVEKNLLLKDQSIWQFRHLANFLFFYAGIVVFFHLIAELFKDGRYGLFGSVLLIVSPRIFAHAFFNPKDTLFLAAFTIALYFCSRFWRKPTALGGLLAGICCAYAANIRLIAISLIMITLSVFLIDTIARTKKTRWTQAGSLTLSFVLALFLFWPASWQSPLEYLQQAIGLFSDYVYWDFRIMYLGKFIRGAEVPWHYLPVWMCITIPMSYIFAFFLGAAMIVRDSIKLKIQVFTQDRIRTKLIILLLYIIPPLLAIILGSTLYNGWRHFQFTYVPFLIVSLFGIQFVLKIYKRSHLFEFKKVISSILLLLLCLDLTTTAVWMIANHPNQQVYFNAIGGILGKENFERDYWRISMKQGWDFILVHDRSESITVCTEDQFADSTFLMILPEADRQRLHIVHEEIDYPACDYAINTYRTPNMYTCKENLHTISVNGLAILSISDCHNQ